jgi:hypothetical protein
MFGLAGAASFFLSRIKTGQRLEKAKAEAKSLLQNAKFESTAFQAKAQEQMLRSMESFAEAEKRSASQTIKIERAISIQEDRLKMREEEVARISSAVAMQDEELSSIRANWETEKQKVVPNISKAAG